MKKNLLISAIVIAIVVATVAISFAAWDLFQKKESVTFNTGNNVELKVSKAEYTTNNVLVPNKAIMQNTNYKDAVIIAKDILLSVTGAETIDTVDYVWSLTGAAVKVESQEPAPTNASEPIVPVINDVDSFNTFFTIVMRPTSEEGDDVALGGKLKTGVKYDLVVKFINDAYAKVQKVDADGKLIFVDVIGNEVNEDDAGYIANPGDYTKVMIDFYGEKYNISGLKAKEIKLDITFEAVNQVPVVTPEVNQ